MSTQNSNNTTYKFGDSDLNLKDYIHNLETNYLSYVNSLNLSLSLQKLFRASYDLYLEGLQLQLDNPNSARFSTKSDGSIIDLTGRLGNEDQFLFYFDNKGNGITADEWRSKNKWGKKKYTLFEANKEVATYLNEVGKALRDAVGLKLVDRTPETNKFDLTKHGFLADWDKTNNPAGENFNYNPYLEMDDVDEKTGQRGTTKRAAHLKELIENYINNIGEYDFSSSPFKDRDTYISRLREAALNLENGYNSEDVRALNRAGIGNDFLSKFFATGEAPKLKSDLELQAELAAKEKLEREKNQELLLVIEDNELEKYNLERSAYLNNWIKENPFLRTIDSTAVTPTYNYDQTVKAIMSNYPNVDLEDRELRGLIMREYVNFSKLVKFFIRGDWEKTGSYGVDKGKDITNLHIARNLDLAYQEGLFNDPRYLTQDNKSIMGDSGFIVVPDSEDYSRYSFIGYNPVTRLYKEFSMLLNPDLSKEINALLRERMAYNAYGKNIQKKEKGGILKFLIGGLGALRHIELYKKAREAKEARDNRVLENAVKNDRTIEELEKYENDSKLLWSDADKLRLGAIGGDIASLIASMTGVGSVASAGIGVASTAANLAADMAEGMGFWESLGNNAISYSLDALSLIPFARAAKVPKTIKAIAGYAPKLIAGISAVLGLTNGEEILKSLKKVKDGESLTVGDWKNISLGLQIVLGGGAAFNRARAANKRLDAARTDSEYVLTNLGTVKLSADKMEKLRNATSLKQLNEILKDSGVTLKGKLTSKFWNRKTSDEAVDIPENFVYDLSKPVTLHSGDLQYQYKFGPGEKLLGGVNLDINFPRVRNAYNKVFHPQAYNRAKSKVTETPKTTETPKKNKTSRPPIKTIKTKPFSEKIKTKVQFLSDLFFSKLGGTLNLSKVRKFLSGSSVTDIKDKPEQPKLNSKINLLSDLWNNPTILYGLPRAVFADLFNKKIIDKTFLKPLLLEPFEFNRYVRSDLDAEALAWKDYALLRSLAQRPLTSDGALLEAMLLLATLEGLKRFEEGKAKSNEVLRQYNELSLQLQKENALNVHNTAMANREKILDIDKARSAVELAYLSKKHNIWDTLWLLLEFDKKSELQENKTLRYKFAVSQIHDMVSKNLGKYAPELSPESVNLYYLVANGNILPSELSKDPAKWQLFLKAQSAASKAELELQRLYFDIPKLNFGDNTSENTWNATITFKDKKGGKLDKSEKIYKANLKAKMEDTKRFNKNVKDSIDRNEKAITRLYKSTKKKK